jgi:hypothetical protein
LTEVEWCASGAVVSPGVVETCAHAILGARGFHDPEFMILGSRSTGGALSARLIAIHPGFVAFAEIRKELLRLAPRQKCVPACDLALLAVRCEDRHRLGPPIRRASSDQVRRLKPGNRVFAIGHLLETTSPGIDFMRPVPSLRFGQLGVPAGFLPGPCAPEDAILLRHDVAMAGGMSGGVLFCAETGSAIGILCASSVALVQDARSGKPVRVPDGGDSFAIRIDLVDEMLSGRATALQETRTRSWREGLARLPHPTPSAHPSPQPGEATTEDPSPSGRVTDPPLAPVRPR